MSYTKGPWTVQPVHFKDATAYNIQPDIARIPSGLHPQPETDANARLISAAPSLLEACQGHESDVQTRLDWLRAYLVDTEYATCPARNEDPSAFVEAQRHCWDLLEALYAAIAKATATEGEVGR